MESYVYKVIPLKEVSTDFPYQTRMKLEDADLFESVARRGVLQPLLVTKDTPKKILAGHLRFKAAQACGLSSIPVMEVQASYSEQDLFVLAVVSNWKQSFSDLDRAWCIYQAAQQYQMTEAEIREEIQPALGLDSGKGVYEVVMQIMSLDPALIQAMAEDKFSYRGAKVLARLCPVDQKTFAGLVERVSFSSGQLQRSVTWLFDLLRLKGKNLEDLLQEESLQAVLRHEKMDARQRAEHFCKEVRALRFPKVVAKEKQFEAVSQQLRKEEGIFFEAPDSFEDQGITLRMKMKGPQSVEALRNVVEKKRKVLNSLFELVLR